MAPLVPTSANAVDREAAWLATVGDTLPALLEPAGGPFDVVQAYRRRVSPEHRSLYVIRGRMVGKRFAAVRSMNVHRFMLQVYWPLRDGQGEAEDDQRALDVAVDMVVARVNGTPGDKTHGGRFLSAAEGTEDVTVNWDDPARTLPEFGALTCNITYTADDFETYG